LAGNLQKGIATMIFGSKALLLSFTICLFTCMLLGCAGQSVYVSPGETTQMGSDFSDTDLRTLAQKMYNSLQMRLSQMEGSEETPVVALLRVNNKTSEHIDTDMIADKLQIELLRSGSLRFVDRSKIQDMARELDLGGSGLMDDETAKKAGSVLGADYLLYGELGSIKKKSGKKQLSYYRLSMKLLDAETNELVWADEGEIKKLSKKPALSW
jgi:uncharacterized protein (TIGR02722 family)